jgi:hypothetical protein
MVPLQAAAVVLARLATFKMEFEEEFDPMRWLDRKLINLAKRFGEYRKDDPHSFQLSPSMSIFPQFQFNLRRSQFIQVRAPFIRPPPPRLGRLCLQTASEGHLSYQTAEAGAFSVS